MTTLLYQKLYSELSQQFTFDLNRRVHISAIIPYLYFHNPSGTFTITLSDSGGTVFSKSFTFSDVKTGLSTSNNYIHCFYPIIPTNPTKIESGTYTVTLTASGYTPTETSFIGWIQQHEDIQNELGYTPTSDEHNPLAIRFKGLKEGII